MSRGQGLAARAAAKGYIVTLKEKARHNPNVFKLMGAADIGAATTSLLHAAQGQGIDKLLIQWGMPTGGYG
jgi:hypothetical protein